MHLKYSLTKDDYKSYYVYVTWASPERRKKRLLHYAKQIGFSLLITTALIYSDIFLLNRRIGYMLVGYVLLSMIFSLVQSQVRMNKIADSFTDDPQNASIFLEHDILLSEEGIVVKDEQTITQSLWSAYIKKEETKAYYFLFQNSVDALIIPKRVFKSTDERLSFEKILTVKLSLDAEIAAFSRR